MSKWERWPWRKLYMVEEGTFANLSVVTRGIAAELLKICDDEGRIVCGSSDLATVVNRRLGAQPRERRLIKERLQELLEDGYLVAAGDGVFAIRNFQTAQRPRRKGDGGGGEEGPGVREACVRDARDVRERGATRARDVREACVRDARDVREASAESDLSARNHSGSRRKNEAVSHARARSEIRVEEIRKEGEGGAGGASPPPSPLRSPPARPPSSFGLTTEKVDGPADLGQAFADGIAKATGSICTAPGKRWDREALKRIAAAAKADSSGGDIPAWIADRANAFARWTLEEETDPRKKRLDVETFERWLNEGQREPLPPHEDPPLDNYPPPRWDSLSEKDGEPAAELERIDREVLARVEARRAEQLAKLQALLATEELKA